MDITYSIPVEGFYSYMLYVFYVTALSHQYSSRIVSQLEQYLVADCTTLFDLTYHISFCQLDTVYTRPSFNHNLTTFC